MQKRIILVGAVFGTVLALGLPFVGGGGPADGRGIGQYLLIEAFQKVPASSLAPFNYFHLLLAVVFSVLVFGQRPDAIALLGIAVIGCAGLALTLPVFRAQWLAILAARQAHR